MVVISQWTAFLALLAGWPVQEDIQCVQTTPVRVVRFVARQSVEARVLEIRAQKLRLAEDALRSVAALSGSRRGRRRGAQRRGPHERGRAPSEPFRPLLRPVRLDPQLLDEAKSDPETGSHDAAAAGGSTGAMKLTSFGCTS